MSGAAGPRQDTRASTGLHPLHCPGLGRSEAALSSTFLLAQDQSCTTATHACWLTLAPQSEAESSDVVPTLSARLATSARMRTGESVICIHAGDSSPGLMHHYKKFSPSLELNYNIRSSGTFLMEIIAINHSAGHDVTDCCPSLLCTLPLTLFPTHAESAQNSHSPGTCTHRIAARRTRRLH